MKNTALIASAAVMMGGFWLYAKNRPQKAAVNSEKSINDSLPGQTSDLLNFDFESLFYPFGKPANTTYPIEQGATMQTKGISNNNPLNVEFSAANPWNGQTGSDGRFSIFETPFYGIRAGARTMKTYRDKYGLNTVSGIVNRWAPPSDNNPTQSYIDFVANNAGVDANQVLTDFDYPLVVAAMIHFENGYNPYDQSEINQAVAAGLI